MTYFWLCGDEDLSPSLKINDSSLEMLDCHNQLNVESKQILKMPCGNRLDSSIHPLDIPSVRLHSRLKDLMQHMSVRGRLIRVTSRFHTVLKNSFSCALEGVTNDSSRDEMVRMKDDKVFDIVDDALPILIECPD